MAEELRTPSTSAGASPSPSGIELQDLPQVFDNLLREVRTFPPSAEFASQANLGAEAYDRAAADSDAFWAEQAAHLSWTRGWDSVLDWTDPPNAKWFSGGRLNVAYNCVDRHVESGHGAQVALHWVGEPGDTRDITYSMLKDEVSRAANALSSLGLIAGDRVVIQLPMIPEAVVSMLACARLGLVHSVVFGGFSPAALRARVDDAAARLVITSDGQYRRGVAAAMKSNVDEALEGASTVEHVLVVRRTGSGADNVAASTGAADIAAAAGIAGAGDTAGVAGIAGDAGVADSTGAAGTGSGLAEPVAMREGRDLWWHDLVDAQSPEHEPESFDSEHPLFILYTSGTTGKPKGILHTSGGYLTQTSYTHRVVFDLKPDTDVYWCGADVGWITGHSYIVYGPLANRVTQVMYEGTPNTPHEGRHFEIIEKYRVSIYYIAPTLIRTFMKWGDQIPASYDLTSLRLLGSVGEPINPEAWMWYRRNIGGGHAPIVDTWWQTETGAIMVAPLPGVTSTKPGSAQRALPGISVQVVDEQGTRVEPGEGGYLVIDRPWPAMTRGIWGDPDRAQEVYWDRFAAQGYYFAGDGAKYDDDGDIWMLGRVDDVMNISGHRISTMEVESALVSHLAVAEAAVVGAADETTGQAIVAFVILRGSSDVLGDAAEQDAIIAALMKHVSAEIGPIAKPKRILVVPELPKTRSGKIMRRLLRDVAENRAVGDTATLADTSAMRVITESLRGAGAAN